MDELNDTEKRNKEVASTLSKLFTIDEMAVLCHDIEIDIESLHHHSGPRENLAIELVSFCKRHSKFDSLIEAIALHRPSSEQAQRLIRFPKTSATYAEKMPFDSKSAFRSIQARCQSYTHAILRSDYSERFDSRLFTKRSHIEPKLLEFLSSDSTVFAIVGDAGTGKSSFFCEIATRQDINASALLINCRALNFSETETVDSLLAREVFFGLSLANLTAEHFDEAGPQILILFDALNECQNKVEFVTAIAEFALKVAHLPVKLILSCRTPGWNSLRRFLRIPAHLLFAPNSDYGFVVDKFTVAELRDVYTKYQNQFNLSPDFENLSPNTRNFISHPLFLKLVSEGYRGHHLPNKMVLGEVFRRYVNSCMDSGGLAIDQQDSPEFVLLHKAIELMCEQASRDVKIVDLQQKFSDSKFRNAEEIFYSAYQQLIDEGLLSQKMLDAVRLRKVSIVFVTYERVFEYLIAEISVGAITATSIAALLDEARNKGFVQLRGAVELALSFGLANKKFTSPEILSIGRSDHIDSRQALVEAIHSIFDNGECELAENTIRELTQDHSANSNTLAVEAAYRLGLDDFLIELAVKSNSERTRDRATLCIFFRWDRLRKAGHLAVGYALIERMFSEIKIYRPVRAKYALSCLLTVSLNILSKFVEDPPAVLPMLTILRNAFSATPGIKASGESVHEDGIQLPLPANIAVDIFVRAFKLIAGNTLLTNDAELSSFFYSSSHKRALLDVGNLFYADSLEPYKEFLSDQLSNGHPLVAYAYLVTITGFLFRSVDSHIPVAEHIFANQINTKFRGRLFISQAANDAKLCLLLRESRINLALFNFAKDTALDVWEEAFESENESDSGILANLNELLREDSLRNAGLISVTGSLRRLLISNFYGDALAFKLKGIKDQESLLDALLITQAASLTKKKCLLILSAIEAVAYLGERQISFESLLEPKYRVKFEAICRSDYIATISRLKCVYPAEIDDLLNHSSLIDILHAVRLHPVEYDAKQPINVNSQLWILAPSVDVAITKAFGPLLLEGVGSSSIDEFIQKLMRTLIVTLQEYAIIDIAHYEWGLAHGLTWDSFSKLGISRANTLLFPKAHVHYRKLSKQYIEKFGLGTLVLPTS